MLPKKLRFRLFEILSLKTMRYVHAVPRRKATGIVAQVYKMIEEDFFVNGRAQVVQVPIRGKTKPGCPRSGFSDLGGAKNR